jgi:hypothetical protein
MFRSLWCRTRHVSIVCTPRSAVAASSPAHSPRPAPKAAARRGGRLQRPRSRCCDRNDSKVPMPTRRRRGRAARDARCKPANSLVHLRGIAAAAALPRLLQGCGCGACGDQRYRRLWSTIRRRWIAGPSGGLSCAGEQQRVPQWRRRLGRVAAGVSCTSHMGGAASNDRL